MGTEQAAEVLVQVKREQATHAGHIPRTTSGNIVELAVRNLVHNQPVKNTEALANPQTAI